MRSSVSNALTETRAPKHARVRTYTPRTRYTGEVRHVHVHAALMSQALDICTAALAAAVRALHN